MKNWIFISIVLLTSCVSQRGKDEAKQEISSNQAAKNFPITIEVRKGPAFNYPTFAFWVEDLEGNYIETLFVTRFIAKGVFQHSEIAPGKWNTIPGEVRRPAALPYWSHKRNIKASDGLYTPSPETAVPDAISGATPKTGFVLNTSLTQKPSGKIRLMLEINQAWDSNSFWSNNKFPGDMDYFASLQPSLVYAATIDPESFNAPVFLNPIGHGHYSGDDGSLSTDLSSLTTAKEIFLTIRAEKKQ